jgi:UDP-N-acetylglucosamine--N-acetylmuramyl-(pentapeptide) pyrophosphoryl-undecaprenol N-acetylglucosamine transferase
MVPARGYAFHPFRVSGFERRLGPALLGSAARAIAAPAACARILGRVRPDVVLGAGGYVAGPMIAAAAARRIPSALMEADAHLGLANRMAAPLARVVLLAFPIAGREPPHYRVVGRPVDPAFAGTTREEARTAYAIPAGDRVVAIFGGSLGAGTINAAAASAFGEGAPANVTVLHVTGRGKLAGVAPADGYRVFEFCDRMPLLLAAADLVVCRAGGSVFEVAAAGRPAVLVPWPGATGDHQRRNAEPFAAGGAAVVVDDDALDGVRLRAEVDSLLADPARLAAMAAAMRGLARPDATRAVADAVLELAG